MTYTNGSPAPTINEQTFKGLVKSHKKRPVTTSRKIAEAFGKKHKNVIRDIRNLECSYEFSELNFEPAKYRDSQGKLRPEYEITRDGFFFIAFGFTGKKAAQFKEAFIEAFNQMEAKLKAREERAYLQAKDFVKLTEGSNFEAIVRNIPFVSDDEERKYYHYFLSLEKLGFSTRSGSVWRRERRHPDQFLSIDNATYVSEDFLYNMYLGQVKRHNDRVFRSASLQLSLNFKKSGEASAFAKATADKGGAL